MPIEPDPTEFFQKSNNLKDPLKLEKRVRFVSSVHFDPSSWQHVHHPRIVQFSMLLFVCLVQSMFLTWGQERS